MEILIEPGEDHIAQRYFAKNKRQMMSTRFRSALTPRSASLCSDPVDR